MILATVTNGEAMAAVIGGLGPDGKLIVVGAPPDPLPVPALALIFERRSVAGWPSGRSIDSEDTMKFAAQTGVRSKNELYPARPRCRGLRPDDERKGAVPGGADDLTTPLP